MIQTSLGLPKCKNVFPLILRNKSLSNFSWWKCWYKTTGKRVVTKFKTVWLWKVVCVAMKTKTFTWNFLKFKYFHFVYVTVLLIKSDFAQLYLMKSTVTKVITVRTISIFFFIYVIISPFLLRKKREKIEITIYCLGQIRRVKKFICFPVWC